MKPLVYLFAVSVVGLLSGCTVVDGSAILVGQRRPATQPEQVQIYSKAPAHYEEIAIVYAKAGHDFRRDQGLMDSAIQKLKEEAAKYGANGVLLEGVQNRGEPTVTSGIGTATSFSGGQMVTTTGSVVGVSRGNRFTKVSGKAIFVH